MVEFLEKPYLKEELDKMFHPIVKEWFYSRFKEYSLPQRYGVIEIHKRKNILISAPTGGTKTLTAFLSILNELVTLSLLNKLDDRVYSVYISPLKSLNNDIYVNLQRPLDEIQEIAKKHGKEIKIRISVRTGDTSAKEKAEMLKKPPHILITTPESLAIVLSSYKFLEHLNFVEWCVIDEIHSLAENKRGVHLSLSLERLQNLCPIMTRIGLSATVAPIEEIAKYLAGHNRACLIANVEMNKKFDLKVISPVKDFMNLTQTELHDKLYEQIHDMIQEHKTTLIFPNTRAGTERVVHFLKQKYPKDYLENIGAHHGSLSKAHRLNIEEKLRKGELKCVVCSTSLELGIDIGFIDLVICLGSPKSVARFLQRIGRSGHSLHETVKGKIIAFDRDDLVECSTLLKLALEKKIDRVHIPENCLDVLSQQIYGMAIVDKWNVDEMFKVLTQSYCYRTLNKADFMSVIDYLSGEFTKLEDRHIYAKIWFDKDTRILGKKGKMARVIYMTNIGTIPDQTGVIVKVGEQVVGTIDEAFLERLKPKDVFVLGGSTYEFKFSRGMVAQVSASEGRAPTVPSWFSEQLPLNFDLAKEITKFRGYLEGKFKNKKSKEEIIKFISEYLYSEGNAAEAIYNYFLEQYLYTEIPTDKKLIIEFYSEEGKKYAIFHSLYGRRVNDVLSRAVAYAISRINHRDVEVGINDNGFYVASHQDMQAVRAIGLLKPEELRRVMEKAIDKSEVLKRRFRHCAVRALMILRQYKGTKRRTGRQQVSSMILMSAVRRVSNDFAILKEARREVLDDLMDLENAKGIIEDIQNKKIEIKQTNTKVPSPFALNLVAQGHLDILRMEDKTEFIKRMHKQVMSEIYGKNN